VITRSWYRTGWLLTSLLTVGLAVAAYVWQLRTNLHGPEGGSPIGLTLGILAAGCILFCSALTLRKLFPGSRWLITSTWVRAHIWVGLVSLPLAVLHAGVGRFGGAVEMSLSIIFGLVIASGVFGLALQEILPNRLRRRVPDETIAGQIPQLCQELRHQSDVAAQSILTLEGAGTALSAGGDRFQQAYFGSIRKFLEEPAVIGDGMASDPEADEQLVFLRRSLTPGQAVDEALEIISRACRERRRFLLQRASQWWLDGWLQVHFWLTAALLSLLGLHVVFATWY
jgi:hypothetical protein